MAKFELLTGIDGQHLTEQLIPRLESGRWAIIWIWSGPGHNQAEEHLCLLRDRIRPPGRPPKSEERSPEEVRRDHLDRLHQKRQAKKDKTGGVVATADLAAPRRKRGRPPKDWTKKREDPREASPTRGHEATEDIEPEEVPWDTDDRIETEDMEP